MTFPEVFESFKDNRYLRRKSWNPKLFINLRHNVPLICLAMFTSDIPHDCKTKHPELRSLLSTIEKEFIKEEMPELQVLYDEYAQGISLAYTLVELGDAISVLQYVNRELLHGNKHEDMQIIKNEVSLRIVKLFDKLDKRVNKYNK